jgi:hypothetical protein
MGNSANHSTAKAVSPNTPILVCKRDASITEANIAALVDRDPGNLKTITRSMLILIFEDSILLTYFIVCLFPAL